MMSLRSYPDGMDCVWIASDNACNVGVFITAGIGPIPVQSLSVDVLNIEDIEEILYRLPHISSCHLLVSMKRPDDFIELSERGFFVYDWCDIHRIKKDYSNAYELIAIPSNPIKLNDLPEILIKTIYNIDFNDLIFIEEKKLDVTSRFECLAGGGWE